MANHGFNPMYMQSKCKSCGLFTGVICSYCEGYVCPACHGTNWSAVIGNVIGTLMLVAIGTGFVFAIRFLLAGFNG